MSTIQNKLHAVFFSFFFRFVLCGKFMPFKNRYHLKSNLLVTHSLIYITSTYLKKYNGFIHGSLQTETFV